MPSKAEIAKTQAFLKSLGIQVEEVDKAASSTRESNLDKEYPPPTQQTSREMASIQAEHVLLSLEYPALAGVTKLCKDCGSPFTTRYPSMGYCGDLCRAAALRKRGIIWWPKGTTEQEKWGGRIPPGNIPPEALKAMQAIVSQVEQGSQPTADTTISAVVDSQPYVSQETESIEYPVESEPVILDKTDEAPLLIEAQEPEDDFLALLDALDT